MRAWMRWFFCLAMWSAWSICAAQAAYSISGKVVNAATGSPLAHASVSLEVAKDGSQYAAVTADENGVFQFLRLPADRYILRGSHRGYITASYDSHDNFSTALVTGEGKNCCANLQLRLVPGGVISGTVADDSGDPVENGQVTLYRETNRTGSERVQRIRTAIVDESGAYEFAGLEPGNYFLAAHAQPWYASRGTFSVFRNINDQNSGTQGSGSDTGAAQSPLDVVYATTFYPDTTDENSAAPVPIKGGDRLTINFSLHAVPSTHLTIQIPQDTNNTQERRFGFFMPQLEHQVFGQDEPVFGTRTMGSRGAVEISVAPGQYELRMPERDGMPGKVVSVDASTSQTVDLSAGSATADVSGKLALSSGGALPENLFALLTTVDGRSRNTSRVEKDGTFTFHGVMPGAYHLNVLGGGKRYHIARMVASGAQVGRRQIEIGSGPANLAAMIYQDLGLSVSGSVKNHGVAVSGAMVVLVPADPVNYRDYFRRAQTDSDGSFVLKDVQPGQYTVVAIQDGWSLDWAQPEVIRHYLQGGQQVAVTEHSPQTTELQAAVEVQPR